MCFGDCIPCFVVSKLIKSKSISIFMVELFRILFVCGDEIVAFAEVLASALGFLYCTDWLHFAKGVGFIGFEVYGRPISLESVFIHPPLLLLTRTRLVINAGRVIEKQSTLLPRHRLI